MTTCACGNCQFFDNQTETAASLRNDGLCRFNPPVPNSSAGTEGLWPVVASKDWCGHFAATVERFMTAAE